MSFHFKLDEPIADGVRRMGLSQLQQIGAADYTGAERHECVHSARRSAKRLRALFCLLRPALSGSQWQAARKAAREVSAALAPARDVKSLWDGLVRLEQQYGTRALGPAGRACSEALGGRLAEEGQAIEVTGRLAAAIREGRKQVKRLGRGAIDIDVVVAGAAAAYRRGRRQLALALKGPGDDDTVHELRKHVQLHRRHLQLLRLAWPEMLMAREAAARELASLLGEDQDLSILKLYLQREREGALAGRRIDSLMRLIARRQRDLRRLSLPMAERLYADRPRALAHALGACWKAAADLLEAGEEIAPALTTRPAAAGDRKKTVPVRAGSRGARRP